MAEVAMTDEEVAAGAAETDEDFEYEGPEGSREEAEDGGEEQPNGNGRRTLADLAAEAPETEEDDEDGEEQQQLFGTERKITASVKGKKPDTSAIKFKAAQKVVSGQFSPDDVVELRVLARLNKVEFVYVRDSDGAIKAVKRVHHAEAVTVEQVNLPLEIQRARLEHAAKALDVDADDLASALEAASAEVGAE